MYVADCISRNSRASEKANDDDESDDEDGADVRVPQAYVVLTELNPGDRAEAGEGSEGLRSSELPRAIFMAEFHEVDGGDSMYEENCAHAARNSTERWTEHPITPPPTR